MHDADVVRLAHRVTDLLEHVEAGLRRQRAVLLQPLAEIGALQQLHREPRRAAVLFDTGADDLDGVQALDLRGDAGFFHEALAQLVVVLQPLVHQLERALFARAELLGHIDLTHSP